MAGWRVNVWMKAEDKANYGHEDTEEDWHYIGIGMDFQINESNGFTTKGGLGSKFQQIQYEGRFKGTFSGNLYMDYNNIYWLLFGLEGYSHATENGVGIHVFSPDNTKSLRPFTLCI